MRWKRGSRALLRLPCAWLLLLLPLAAAAGLGEEVATTPGHHRHGADVPVGPSESGGSEGGREEPQRTARRLDEDEESRILWRGWLLVDEAPTRRKAHITPKSVFIAPMIRGEGNRGIPACAEGYRSDAMGRCHKVVRVNQAAHLDFLLQRLNALYREPSPSSAPAVPQSDAGEKGPLLVTIPLATNPPQNEESEEEGDEVDLVVVVEASMQKDAPGGVPSRLGLFGEEQQVAAESQEDVVVREETRSPSDNPEEDAEDELLGAADLERNATGVIVGDHSGDFVKENGKKISAAQLETHAELSIEPVIQIDSGNSTEESTVRREVSHAGSVGQLSNDSPLDKLNETVAFVAPESNVNDTNAERTTDVHFVSSHIYETTFIANYATTESSVDKVTELPEVLHKQNLEIAPDGNISGNKTEEMKMESQKRVVFPGRVEERVRFPDAEERRSPSYPQYPSTTPSPEGHWATHPQPQKPTSRPWGVWNRPMLLKFWTQMPLVREPTHSPDSVTKGALPTASDEDTSSLVKPGESWSLSSHSDAQSKVHHGGPYQRRPLIYYQEMSPRDLASVSRVFDRVRHF
ncbi:uncharacterized protein [Hetaerina americana]|uniref:uncharacterized protein n=1 Tax=Hetaerina americana TaxID=62018 RepID=UPI003A7F3BF4